jgi:hypothetical protein
MLTAALLSSYAAIDADFWADVDSRVGAAATPRFKQYCAQFRKAWAAEAAPDPAASALDDEVARPSLLDTGQFVTRHAGAFPGLTARPFWDVREFPWLEPLVAAAPAMAAELAAARGDTYDAALAPGRAVDVFFEDGTSDTGTIDSRVDSSYEDGTRDAGTIDGVDASTYDVRYADGEVERLDRSHVAPRGSAWLRKLRKRYPWPRALAATGFEHFSVARALASAELCGNQPGTKSRRWRGAPDILFPHRCREGRVHRHAHRAARLSRPGARRRARRPLPAVREPALRGILAPSAAVRAGGALGPLELVPDGPRAPSDAVDAAARHARRPAFTRSAGRRRAAAHAFGRRGRRLRPRDLRRGPLGRRGTRGSRGGGHDRCRRG